MGFGVYWRAYRGDLLPCAGEAGSRLVGDTGFFARLFGADFRRVPGLVKEGHTSQYKDRSFLVRGWGCGAGASGTDCGGLRRRAFSFPGFAGNPADRIGALFWRLGTSEGTSIPPADPAAGDSDSCYRVQSNHSSASDPGVKAGQRAAPYIRGTGAARGEYHRTPGNEAGGGGGL